VFIKVITLTDKIILTWIYPQIKSRQRGQQRSAQDAASNYRLTSSAVAVARLTGCRRGASRASVNHSVTRAAIANYPPPVKGDPSSPLAEFTPRQLIEELHNRGYRGELQYLYTIKV
jgi:hypothetical protein